MTRRLFVPLLVLAGLLVLAVSPVSLVALVPRTPTGLLIVAGLMALLVLWGKVLVPRLTSRPALGGALTAAPVLLLVGAVLVPALVDRQVDEGLLEGIPVAQAQEMVAASAPPSASPEALVGTSEAPGSVETLDSSVATASSAPASPAAPAPASPAAAAPVRLSAGDIRGVGHRASGQAAVYRSGQTTFVRLEDLTVQGAIDVVVYLVPGADQVNPDGGVSLGSLKGTLGNANYVVPAGIDLEQYGAVLLWCRAVSTPIAAATQT